MIDIQEFISRLEQVSGGNGKWLACCPAHDDKSPSLSIKQTNDGKILIHCFAGCGAVQVLVAVGLSMADLFPNSNWKRPPGYRPNEIYKAVSTAEHCQQRNLKKHPPKQSDLAFIQHQIKVLRYTEKLIKTGAYDG